MKHLFLPYKSSSISYYSWGSGPKIMVCFHGYGEDALSFGPLAANLDDFTVIAIDLPYHGSTNWNNGNEFTPEDLINIVLEICSNKENSIDLLGYSMGGRVCMQLAQMRPRLVERLILLAPDGFHQNFWYNLATQTIIGNKIFHYSMKHPGALFTLMKTMCNTGLLQPAFNKIAHYYLDKEEERVLLFKRWTLLRKFKLDKPLFKKGIVTHNMQVRMLFGKYDKIILSNKAQLLAEDLPNHVKIRIIEAGHQLLKEKYISQVAALMYQ